MPSSAVPSLLRYRVINRITGTEITPDLPHLHQSSWTVMAMQPGNPGSSAIGSFTIPLHPPGSPKYDAAFALYISNATQRPLIDGLFLRVEAYISHDGASLGKLKFAGFITNIDLAYGENSHFILSGVTDLGLANLSKPFPGESLTLAYGSGSSVNSTYRQARNYFGTNELGATDNFNPYTSGNYTSTNEPALTSGTWSGTTDDGLNVITCSTGSGAVLINKTGTVAQDKRASQFVEVTGRFLPSADTGNSGSFGVGLSKSNADITNSIQVLCVTNKNATTGHWDMSVKARSYVASVLTDNNYATALTNVDDPEGYIPFTISVFDMNAQGHAIVVNGKVVGGPTTSPVVAGIDFGTTNPAYPFIRFGTPASGSAQVFMTNLVQEIRYTDDQNNNTAAFKSGTIGTPAHSLPIYSDPGPSFLEVWTNTATREGWYWRYTPTVYVLGVRTIGTIDMATDPGTDRTASVIFSRTSGNLLDLQLTSSTQSFASGTALSSVSGTDGGGTAYWRDTGTMTKYGVLDDQSLMLTAPTFGAQRTASRQVVANKIATSTAGSKVALVLRDPQTADVWRELDRVTIDDPVMGINHQSARIVGYTFTEGSATQQIILDQFSVEDITIPSRRVQQGLYVVANKFSNR